MTMWKMIVVGLLGFSVIANYAYWLLIAKPDEKTEEIDPDVHDQTFSM